jgi:hypothetical protein
MYTINLVSIPFVVFFAWAKGRGLLRWAVMAYLFGFYSFIFLLFVKTKPIKIYEIPQYLKDLITQLQDRQISVWRTDQSGGLALATPNKIRVTGKEWWQIRWG